MTVTTAACLGKVPTYGDFVRHRASTPTMRALGQWIRRGLHHARTHRPADWEERYDHASPTRFLIGGGPSRGPNAILGVMAPSRDQGGRVYPFTVTCEVPKHALDSQSVVYLPVQAEPFFDAADALVQRATDGALPHDEVGERVEQMNVGLSVCSGVPPNHKRYLKTEAMGPLLEELFGHFGDSKKYQLFSTLLDTLLPLQDRTTPQLDDGLVFPLPDDEGQRAHVVSFWLTVVRRVLGEASVSPTLFWSPSTAGGTAELLLYVGAAGPRAFYESLVAERGEAVRVLEEAGEKSGVEAALSIPEAYGRLLEDEQMCLWDFLEQL